MAQINLLSTEVRKQPASLTSVTPILVKVLSGVLILLVVYYGFNLIRAKAADSKLADLQTKITKQNASLSQNDDRNEVLTRQAQLKDLRDILSKHLYWSLFLNSELPRITLQSASYSTVNVSSNGLVSLVVSVPTYSDLDKYLQVFNLDRFNKDFNQFTNIQIKSITRTQKDNNLLTSFRIELKFNTDSISYPTVQKATEQAPTTSQP